MIIYDQVDYVTKDEHTRRREAMKQFLENWKSSWEAKDVEKYLSFYDSSFSAPGFKNFNAWKNHKSRMKSRSEFIKVTLSQPFMLIHRNELIVKTLQKYQSSEYVDYGIKINFPSLSASPVLFGYYFQRGKKEKQRLSQRKFKEKQSRVFYSLHCPIF